MCAEAGPYQMTSSLSSLVRLFRGYNSMLNNHARLSVYVISLVCLLTGPSGSFALASPGDITRASVASSGTQANGGSGRSVISGNGRYVAFYSDADNLVAGDTNATSDIFVRDRQTGITERVSLADNENQANESSESPAISSDGRFVAFG